MVNGMAWSANVHVTDDMREAFCVEYLKNGRDHFEAGKKIYPANPDKGLALGMELITQDVIQARIRELSGSQPARNFLPSKDDVARQLWNIVSGKTDKRLDGKDLLAGIRLYAEIMSFIEKPQVGLTAIQNNINSKVMIVASHGTDDEWEEQAVRQQQKLIADANAG